MLAFEYMMELDFGNVIGKDPTGAGDISAMAREHAFTLRCIPQETPVQHVTGCELHLEPDVPLSYGTDAFGTRYCYGLIHGPHRKFQVQIKGEAQRYPERYEEAPLFVQPVYRQHTEATEPGAVLREMSKAVTDGEISENEETFLQRAIHIRDLVFRFMTYAPGATAPFTTAEEAAESGRGVCQDYAHIMLALCRMEGIPCRYTAGLLLGEGSSHAWVEICSNGKWIPMDPTNPNVGWDVHLVFSHGRDARDCEINRGIYLGPHAQTQKISARLQLI